MAPALVGGNNLEDEYQSGLISPHPQTIRVSMSMDPLRGFQVKSEFQFIRVPWHSSPAPVLPPETVKNGRRFISIVKYYTIFSFTCSQCSASVFDS